jgi:chromosome segregation ATPase
MGEKKDRYEQALAGKKIPILTLDNKWHQLFTMMEPDKHLTSLEEEMNALLCRQGKLNTESKSLKKIKKKLMDEIVELMESEDASSNKKIEENRRLIEECNQKLDEYQDELLDLPTKIDEVNHKLMIRTMEMCYEVLQVNSKEIEEISAWINQVRIDLKLNVVRKQEKEIKNHELYTYMHNIFGADVIEIFDMKYNPMDSPIRKKAREIKEEKVTDE